MTTAKRPGSRRAPPTAGSVPPLVFNAEAAAGGGSAAPPAASGGGGGAVARAEHPRRAPRGVASLLQDGRETKSKRAGHKHPSPLSADRPSSRRSWNARSPSPAAVRRSVTPPASLFSVCVSPRKRSPSRCSDSDSGSSVSSEGGARRKAAQKKPTKKTSARKKRDLQTRAVLLSPPGSPTAPGPRKRKAAKEPVSTPPPAKSVPKPVPKPQTPRKLVARGSSPSPCHIRSPPDKRESAACVRSSSAQGQTLSGASSPRKLANSNKDAFRRTLTLPLNGDGPASPTSNLRRRVNSTALTPRELPSSPPSSQTASQYTASSPLTKSDRLDEGLPIGIPTGLLPACDMPPREVLLDADKRRHLLLKVCDELEASMPDYLKTWDVSEEAKKVVKQKGGRGAEKQPETSEQLKPVTSRFIRRILILFYASRNEAEEHRCRLERAVAAGCPIDGQWPPSIVCMHAAYTIIDFLVRIGHRRVLKMLFGTLFWHVVDVLEWPPQPFGGKVRMPHRSVVMALPAPDPTLVPVSQREDVVKLHRMTYIQNSCLVKACDSVTYYALNEFIEAEKLRILHSVIDTRAEEPADPPFLSRWAVQWCLLYANQHQGILKTDDATSERGCSLLASLLASATSSWEHDLIVPFLHKLHTLGIVTDLFNALQHSALAPPAAEVLALLASDPLSHRDVIALFLGVERSCRIAGWQRFVEATAGEGSKGARELVSTILAGTEDAWDVMMYLQAVEELAVAGFLKDLNAEGARNFCDSINILILPMGRVFREAFAGKVAALIVQELSPWLQGTYSTETAGAAASVLRTLALLVRVPCKEAVEVIQQQQIFQRMTGFIPTADCLVRSAALSLCRAVWWRTDAAHAATSQSLTTADVGTYVDDDDEDVRFILQEPAAAFVKETGLDAILQNVMLGQNTLCPLKHSKPGVRSFFTVRTHYE
ncbi:hypothetical protein DIPPA_03019 [Diplonema papillatum]|nr:hypothetical protein DIPPA_03019 [Diplonema papillatum]